MKKLVSTSEAAKLLGLSVQGVHYRIKKQRLESIKKDGKTFVYIDSNITPKVDNKPNIQIDSEIVKSKDEQIILLKETIKWMKKQYKQEIKRLDNNQIRIIDVFKSEIVLLQQAYTEMQNIYKISYKDKDEDKKQELDILTVEEFFILMRSHGKSNIEIKSIILNKIKDGDRRFIYNSSTKELLIYRSDFIDLI
ncbi:MAG: DNA-binding protein [Arcobacteraceae bacterium]|nr:DNA-binding protein [Arcobacteraceae bacterium]